MKKILTVFIILFISQFVVAQTKIDEYEKLISEDEGVRLHRISQEFLQNKDSKIYILINKEKKMPFGRFLRYFYGVKHWLTRDGISKEAIVMLAGEEKDKQFTQFWFVRNNENPPVFKEISIEEKPQEKITKKTLFDTNCIDCDESPFIKLGMFREGLDYVAEAMLKNPNCKFIAEIQVPNYYSKKDELKQRNELIKLIIEGLKKHQISRNKISIKFSLGDEVKFYLVPNLKQK